MAAIGHLQRITSRFMIEFPIAAGLVALDVAARLLPHAPNFTPIAASAVFAGTILRSRALALAVPLAAMLVSDCFLGGYDWPVMGVVYGALMLPALLAYAARRFRASSAIVPVVLSSSLIFFVTTNFAVWGWSGMYPLTLSGLVHCYVAALPFFQNTVCGDLFWSAVLFSAWWLARRGIVGPLSPLGVLTRRATRGRARAASLAQQAWPAPARFRGGAGQRW
jgi:hypothetical protein